MNESEIYPVKKKFGTLTSALLYSMTNAFNAATALTVSFLNAYVLGAQGRGETANTLQWAYVVWPVMTLGLDRYLSRHVAISRSGLASLMRIPSTLALSLTAVLLVCHLGIFFTVVPMVALGSAYLALIRVWSMKNLQTRTFILTTMTYSLMNIGVSLTLFMRHDLRPVHWLLPYAIPGIACIVESTIGIRVPFVLTRSHLRDSSKLVLGALSSALILRLDRLVLGAAFPTANLGRYVVVATVFEAMLWPIFANAQIVASQSSLSPFGRLVTKKRMAIWLCACTITSAVLCVALPILGPTYVPARELIFPLALSTGPLALAQFQWANLLKSDDWKSSGHPAVVGALFAFIIYPVVIINFGGLGAAWGSVLCYSTVAISGWFYWRKSTQGTRTA